MVEAPGVFLVIVTPTGDSVMVARAAIMNCAARADSYNGGANLNPVGVIGMSDREAELEMAYKLFIHVCEVSGIIEDDEKPTMLEGKVDADWIFKTYANCLKTVRWEAGYNEGDMLS